MLELIDTSKLLNWAENDYKPKPREKKEDFTETYEFIKKLNRNKSLAKEKPIEKPIEKQIEKSVKNDKYLNDKYYYFFTEKKLILKSKSLKKLKKKVIDNIAPLKINHSKWTFIIKIDFLDGSKDIYIKYYNLVGGKTKNSLIDGNISQIYNITNKNITEKMIIKVIKIFIEYIKNYEEEQSLSENEEEYIKEETNRKNKDLDTFKYLIKNWKNTTSKEKKLFLSIYESNEDYIKYITEKLPLNYIKRFSKKKINEPKNIEENKIDNLETIKKEEIFDYSKQDIPKNKRKCQCGMITGITSQSIKNHNKTPIHQDYLRLLRSEPIDINEKIKIMEILNLILSHKYGTRQFHHGLNVLKEKYPFIADNIENIYKTKKGFDFYPTPIKCFDNPTIKWAINRSENALEPTSGLGALITFMLNINSDLKITGNELNSDFIPILEKIFETDKQIFITNENFLTKDYSNNKFDLIVCNPPFTNGGDSRYYYNFLFKCLQVLNQSTSKDFKRLIFISPNLIPNNWHSKLSKITNDKKKETSGLINYQFDISTLLGDGYITIKKLKEIFKDLLNVNMDKSTEEYYKLCLKNIEYPTFIGNTDNFTYTMKKNIEDIKYDVSLFEDNFDFGYGEVVNYCSGFGGTGLTAYMHLFEIHKRTIGGNKNNKKDFVIHRVNVNKDIPFKKALKYVKDITHSKKEFKKKIVGNQYHFKIKPKTKFKYFKGKKINNDITIIFGKLK